MKISSLESFYSTFPEFDQVTYDSDVGSNFSGFLSKATTQFNLRVKDSTQDVLFNYLLAHEIAIYLGVFSPKWDARVISLKLGEAETSKQLPKIEDLYLSKTEYGMFFQSLVDLDYFNPTN